MSNQKILDCIKATGVDENLADELLKDGFDYDKFLANKTEREANNLQRKRQLMLQSIADQNNKAKVDKFIEQGGTPEEALTSIEGKTTTPINRIDISKEVREDTINAEHLAMMPKTREHFKPRYAGLMAPVEHQEDIVKALFNQPTDNTLANQIAGELKSVFENQRARFNRAGGSIRHLEDWGLPQEHNPHMMVKHGFEKWDKKFRETADFERMGLDEKDDLRYLYDTLIGDVEEEVAVEQLSKPFTDRFSQERKIHFKDAGAWLDYQKDFGSRDFYGTMLNHIMSMSEAIARLETYGPSPDLGFKRTVAHAQSIANKQAAEESVLKGKKVPVKNVGNKATAMYKLNTGKVAVANEKWARFNSNLRTAVVNRLAGKILMSSVTDIPLSTWRALYNGLGSKRAFQVPFRMVRTMINNSDAETALKMGYVSNSQLGHFNRIEGRFDDNSLTDKFLQKMSEFMFRAQGLTRWTESAQIANVLETGLALGELSAKKWDALPFNLRRMLGRYGIEESEWKIMRKSLSDVDGGKIVDPSLIEDIPLKRKVMGLYSSEAKEAVPTPGSREASIFRQQEAGTLVGEIARNLGVFKSFPITMVNTFITPALNKHATISDKALATFMVFVVLPMFGYLAKSAKQMVAGQKPNDPFKDIETFSKEWFAGFLQGGGTGIVGDLLFSSENRFGGGKLETAAGPVAGAVGDIFRIGETLLGSGVEGDEDKFDKALTQAFDQVKSYTMPFTSLWYANLLSEKYVEEPIRQKLDPAHKRRKIRKQRKKEREGVNNGIWFNTVE